MLRQLTYNLLEQIPRDTARTSPPVLFKITVGCIGIGPSAEIEGIEYRFEQIVKPDWAWCEASQKSSPSDEIVRTTSANISGRSRRSTSCSGRLPRTSERLIR